MKWIGISGSWRYHSDALEQDVRAAVRAIYAGGNGIVAGGALGVDSIATDEALRLDPTGGHVKVILPTSLPIFRNHMLKRAAEGVITFRQAQNLIAQLETVKIVNPDHLTQMAFTECNPDTYYARNGAVIEAVDALEAFQVNNTAGTQDTIDKAKAKPIPVTLHSYTIHESKKRG